MSPKEKAEELILKFMRLQEPNYNWFHSKLAKQCALIAVDEMLNCPAMNDCEQVKYSDGSYAREYYEVPNKYWSKVKQEIEKL
jgi:nitrogenase molybdenum-iron protein alpha/beta subunit